MRLARAPCTGVHRLTALLVTGGAQHTACALPRYAEVMLRICTAGIADKVQSDVLSQMNTAGLNWTSLVVGGTVTPPANCRSHCCCVRLLPGHERTAPPICRTSAAVHDQGDECWEVAAVQGSLPPCRLRLTSVPAAGR